MLVMWEFEGLCLTVFCLHLVMVNRLALFNQQPTTSPSTLDTKKDIYNCDPLRWKRGETDGYKTPRIACVNILNHLFLQATSTPLKTIIHQLTRTANNLAKPKSYLIFYQKYNLASNKAPLGLYMKMKHQLCLI